METTEMTFEKSILLDVKGCRLSGVIESKIGSRYTRSERGMYISYILAFPLSRLTESRTTIS